MSFLGLSLLSQYSWLFFQGLTSLLKIWLNAFLISFLLGTLLGILQSKRIKIPVFSSFVSLYVRLVHGMTDQVQVLLVYLLLPEITGIQFSYFVTETIALSLCSTAYIIEMVRIAIDNYSQEQVEAYTLLGFSYFQTLRYVILPQVVKNLLPSFIGQAETLMKYTAIFSVLDFFSLVKVLNPTLHYPLAIGLFVSIVYLGLAAALVDFLQGVSRKLVMHKV